MAQVVYGTAEEANYSVFAVPTRQVFDSINQNFQEFRSKIHDSAMMMFDKASEMFKKVEYSDAMRSVRAATRGLEMIYTPNTIQPLNGIGALQNAPDVMIPLMMACPDIRERYHAQTISGYGDRYIDNEAGLIGEAHTDYRRVTSGVFMENAEGDWCADVHFDHTPEEEQLDFTQQLDVMHAWEGMREFLGLNLEDPTSPANAML